jgi:hypothetical protein
MPNQRHIGFLFSEVRSYHPHHTPKENQTEPQYQKLTSLSKTPQRTNTQILALPSTIRQGNGEVKFKREKES